jgi:hypothetical protein
MRSCLTLATEPGEPWTIRPGGHRASQGRSAAGGRSQDDQFYPAALVRLADTLPPCRMLQRGSPSGRR